MSGLTLQQRACLQAIRDLTDDGVPPTYEELRRALGLAAKSSIHRLLTELKSRGMVDFAPRKQRSLYLVGAEITPAMLNAQSSEALRRLIAYASGILAHRDGDGGGQTAEALDRIRHRLVGLPLLGAGDDH